jgi:phage antirepressor YoqD-like protein
MVQKMDSNISIFAPKTDRIKCNYKTNGLMLINDLAKTEMDSLDKIDSQIIQYIYYNDVSISFGDILKQVDNVDMKIVDQYLLKKIQNFH